MNAVVDSLKTKKAEKFDIYNVVAVRDYSSSVRRLADGSEEALNIPKTNAVYYELENGGFICVRPSGTEALIRVMVEAKTEQIALLAAENLVNVIKML